MGDRHSVLLSISLTCPRDVAMPVYAMMKAASIHVVVSPRPSGKVGEATPPLPPRGRCRRWLLIQDDPPLCRLGPRELGPGDRSPSTVWRPIPNWFVAGHYRGWSVPGQLPAIHSFGILPQDEDGSLVPPGAVALPSLRVVLLVSTGRLFMSFFSLHVPTVVL